MSVSRLSTGVPGLDEHLGGGLLPGTLTVVVGSTGIGKTQFGLQFAQAGVSQESRRGVVFDLSARGDPQSHADYARRMFDWELRPMDPAAEPDLTRFFSSRAGLGDYLHIFDVRGQRVTRRDLEFDAWHDWQAHLAQRLAATVAFFYGHFTSGVRRAVIDGIEPVDRASDSVQIELFEYIYHQILRKDPEWVARDLFRQHYRAMAEQVSAHLYDPAQVGCVLLYTAHETTLDALVERPLAEGDLLSNANTLIYLGKIREGTRFRRALYIAKHRGSACTDEILPYQIGEGGLSLG